MHIPVPIKWSHKFWSWALLCLGATRTRRTKVFPDGEKTKTRNRIIIPLIQHIILLCIPIGWRKNSSKSHMHIIYNRVCASSSFSRSLSSLLAYAILFSKNFVFLIYIYKHILYIYTGCGTGNHFFFFLIKSTQKHTFWNKKYLLI